MDSASRVQRRTQARPPRSAGKPSPLRRAGEALPALRASGSVGLAVFPIGIAFGMLVVHSGLAWWWATVFATVIFAGSLEFLMIGLVTAGVPLPQIALTAFLVNSRHVFYALSFPLSKIQGKAGNAYGSFAMTDEAYALATADPARSWSGRRILWLQAFIQSYWVSGAPAGALLGTAISVRIPGLGFAMTALFAVLAIDAFLARRDVPTPILAVACALIAKAVLPGQLLLAGLALFTLGLLARHALRRKALAHA